jgi:octaprenyl-diphosphate synthase
MRKIILNKDFSKNDFRILLEYMEKYGGFEYTRKIAAQYIDKAKTALSVFEPSQPKEIMLDIANYALARRV